MLEKTITGNEKIRLNSQYPIVAGVDKDNVPQLLKTGPNGELLVSSGFNIPHYDELLVHYADTGKTNPDVITYKFDGNTVATLTITYAGGGTSPNDVPIRVQLT